MNLTAAPAVSEPAPASTAAAGSIESATTAGAAAAGPSHAVCRALIDRYLRATNENRAHLLAGVFDPQAKVAFDSHTQGISVPPLLSGIAAIAETLVQRVGSSYGNIYTFCLDDDAAASADPAGIAPSPLTRAWLVAMTAKTDGTARLGWGRYRWRFDRAHPAAPWLATHLTIAIDQMKPLSRPLGHALITWAGAQPYPFCSPATLLASLPLQDAALRAFLASAAAMG